MKIKSVNLPEAVGAQTNYVSAPIALTHIAMFAAQIAYSASACTFKLQGSCDEGVPTENTQAAAAAKVITWTDIANTTTAALTGSGNVMWNVPDCGYAWVRIVQVGTATITSAKVNVKGI